MANTLQERQLDREAMANQNGLDRLLEEVRRAREVGREYDMSAGARVLAGIVQRISRPMKALQIEANKSVRSRVKLGGHEPGWELAIQALSAEMLSYLTVRACFNAYNRPLSGDTSVLGVTLTNLAANTGYYVWLECKYRAMRAQEGRIKRDGGVNRLAALQRYVKTINPRSVNKWLRLLAYKDILEPNRWSPKMRVRLGMNALKVMLADPACPFQTVSSYINGKTYSTLVIREDFKEVLDTTYRDAGLARPIHRTMVIPPTPWAVNEGTFVGGYMEGEAVSIHVGRRLGDDATAHRPHPANVGVVTLNALNRVQRVPWRVNQHVLKVVEQATADWDRYVDILKVEPLRQLGDKIPDEIWADMTNDERRGEKRERAKIHDHNFQQENQRRNMLRALSAAQADRDEDAFWFPHGIDFRHRMYPIPQDFHPQGNDMCRGMLEFSEGVPLGTEGYKWLVFHLANCYGLDKVDRQTQTDWYNDNLEEILSVADDPLGTGYAMMKQAADPWQFFAACFEVCRMCVSEENAVNYVSHLPVFVDGTCNGLQHMSAMGRDAEGAHTTNLTADPARQDIYQIVADKISRRVDADFDLGEGSPECVDWHGGVSRDVVKRGVMTVPYGLTKIGMRDQLIKDGWTDDPKAAAYLTDLMQEAIGGSVQSAALIMEWLQFNVKELATLGLPFTWMTPAGGWVTQAYRQEPMTRLVTVLGMVRINEMTNAGQIMVSKQEQGVVPNLIHSFDAAHLACVADAFEGRMGVVHDSFGTHAAHMDDLQRIIREQFAQIYDEDWLGLIQGCFIDQAPPGVLLREPPELGTWNPKEVLESAFFFC